MDNQPVVLDTKEATFHFSAPKSQNFPIQDILDKHDTKERKDIFMWKD